MASKFLWLGGGILAIAVVVALLLLGATLVGRVDRTRLGRNGHLGEGLRALFFVGPTLLLVAVGLVWPTMLTVIKSLRGASGTGSFGVDNYVRIFSSPDLRHSIINTAIWVILVPVVSIIVGLVYAIILDRARVEVFAKTLIFLPMAISMVGASVIWRFVYEYKPTAANQTGILNAVLKGLGFETREFLTMQPWNTVFLIVVMIWIQAGFAMTLLSAAIKAIPDEIIEAAKIDGAQGWALFRFITLPSIRPTMIMVLTTIAIAALKVFDIVRTMTSGNFGTSVVANDFYSKSFPQGQPGLGAALAVLLFVLVLPIIVYNVRQLRQVN